MGVDAHETSNMHNEIKIRISTTNPAYLTFYHKQNVELRDVIKKLVRKTLYLVLASRIAIYEWETYSTTQVGEEKLLTFERHVLRKIHGPTRNQNVKYEKRKNAEREKLYRKPNIGKYVIAKWLIG